MWHVETWSIMHEFINEVKECSTKASRKSFCDPIFYGHFQVVLIVISNTYVINYPFVVSIDKPPFVLTTCSIVEMEHWL